ncbi:MULTISPECIES: helix-turn-helix transcriptional regulator [Oscillospiraceae]|uniref:helix-turn-helix transcriptional regulator n=1 Tax=Oscillospiraceae TaxID=216572 RepID=UPI000E659CC1
MLAEVLADRGEWVQVMPGARACLFSLEESPFPLHLPLHLDHLHFETLFCQSGTMALTRRDGSALRLGARQVLLLTDLSGLAGARVDTPLAGILVAVDARGARGSLDTICDLLGGLNLDTGQVRRWMARREGCAVEGPTHWSRAAFADLDRLPRSEQARWCVWKSVELLYLLSAQEEETPDAPPSPALDRKTALVLDETRRYMEEHLDEHLTIPTLSRRALLSATTFKKGFHRMYGLPVHTWLRQRRMERAAKLLQDSSLSVLGVAQAVGYGSVSQFSAAFRRQYGLTPAQYRKNA